MQQESLGIASSVAKELEILTMCLVANTPSTMAQQKAATTPKLMNTIDATSWKG